MAVEGPHFREGAELFDTASWVAVLLGQGIVPEEPEPAAYAADESEVADLLDRMRMNYRQTAERMPRHADFIARTCAAQPVMPS